MPEAHAQRGDGGRGEGGGRGGREVGGGVRAARAGGDDVGIEGAVRGEERGERGEAVGGDY